MIFIRDVLSDIGTGQPIAASSIRQLSEALLIS
jgi:hypothetical protein